MVWIPCFLNHTANELPYKDSRIVLSTVVGYSLLYISFKQAAMNHQVHITVSYFVWLGVSQRFMAVS